MDTNDTPVDVTDLIKRHRADRVYRDEVSHATTERTCETCRYNVMGKNDDICDDCDATFKNWKPRPAAQDADELNPCPFCGETPTQPERTRKTGRPVWEVSCKLFCVSMRRTSRKEVVEAWNRRPSRPMSANGVPVELFPSFSALLDSIDKGEQATEWEKGFAAGVVKANEAAKNRPMSAEVEPRRLAAMTRFCEGMPTECLELGPDASELAAHYPDPDATMSAEVEKAIEAIEYIGCHTDHGEQPEPCPICEKVDEALKALNELKEKV